MRAVTEEDVSMCNLLKWINEESGKLKEQRKTEFAYPASKVLDW